MSVLRRRLKRNDYADYRNGGGGSSTWVKQTWEEMYDELLDYRREFGDCEVNTHATKLGRWVSTQRGRYSHGDLLPDRKALLEKIGFTWVLQEVDGPIRDWLGMLGELRKYKEEHGDCLVPTVTTKLGRWVSTQRARREGPTSSAMQLYPEQVEMLDELGFVWSLVAEKFTQTPWEERYLQLEAYHQEHGHCRVPRAGPYAKLWRWNDTQRQKYKRNELNAEQVQKMNDLDFVWQVNEMNMSWEDMYQQLKEFYEREGHCKVTAGKHSKLASWLSRQRMLRRRSIPGNREITKEQIGRLEELGIAWEAADYDEMWEEKFDELQSYADANGHCRVPCLSGPLGTWVRKQRQCRNKNSGSNQQLSDAQIARLDSIGFVWRADDNIESWESMYEKLKEYKDTHGNSLVPQSQGKLGSWVDFQRRRKNGPCGRQKQLTQEQIALLDGLNFAWSREDRTKQLWDVMFEELKDYAEQNGHCKVPGRFKGSGNGPAKLGKWVEKQRARHNSPEKYGELSEDQLNRLNGIGFLWSVKKCKAASISKERNASISPKCTKKRKRVEGPTVGESIAVYWPDDDVYYRGTIEQIGGNGHMFIKYDDGDKLWLDPKKDRYKVLQPGDPLPPREISPKLDTVAVGSRLDVWWPLEQEFHAATVRKIKPKRSTPYRLKYDDSDKEWTDLSRRKFLLRSD